VLNIDRVDMQMDVLPEMPGGRGQAGPPPLASSPPLTKEQFRVAVLDVLRDHLRELERSGVA
jgi:hypothetical protein